MTALLVILAAASGTVFGMALEWRSGRLDHWIRKIAPPAQFPQPQPVLHDEFIDDCDRFNKALLGTPFYQRVFEASGRLQ